MIGCPKLLHTGRASVALLALLGLAGCAGSTGGGGASARARLVDADGAVVGDAVLEETAAGVRVTITVDGLPAGEHGVHVHTTGRCEVSADGAFTSAGGHFNPDGRQHGLENPAGPHAGDLPNMSVGADGRGTLTATTDRFTLSEGGHTLFDADGAAIVVHADRDDLRSDPAGNAGARIACGVLSRT